jgi:2-polyprenyl-6-methoxyphenol hydroxylase-like FAD-dependent oxidoreductase
VLGLLLARAGVAVLVLEKHKDFLRDFRGDTIHPSTLELLHELGLLEEFLSRPHQKVEQIKAHVGDRVSPLADFSRLKGRCPFIAFMPQWDFLDLLTSHAQQYPGFRLRMEAEVGDLLWEGDRVIGVIAKTPDGEIRVRADLVIGADGRNSTIRERAGLPALDLGAPIDVLWFRLSKQSGDPIGASYRLGAGQFMVLIDRTEYWQCAYVIPKGAFEAKRAGGLAALRADVVRCSPFLHDRVEELTTWDDIKLLSVRLDRLRQWSRDGVLCIGDCAHAMSPVGGVGINLAIQDAVATARLLAGPLLAGKISLDDLRAVQRRRKLPTRLTQWAQIFMHEHFLQRIFAAQEPFTSPWPMRVLGVFPALRRLLGRMIGFGFRPERVR